MLHYHSHQDFEQIVQTVSILKRAPCKLGGNCLIFWRSELNIKALLSYINFYIQRGFVVSQETLRLVQVFTSRSNF